LHAPAFELLAQRSRFPQQVFQSLSRVDDHLGSVARQRV
jgi:hypothetical protein